MVFILISSKVHIMQFKYAILIEDQLIKQDQNGAFSA